MRANRGRGPLPQLADSYTEHENRRVDDALSVHHSVTLVVDENSAIHPTWMSTAMGGPGRAVNALFIHRCD
ncbi:hypothetical protein SAMN05216588_112124 [Pseudomonas flavescens]|uniref:Uncharacterized protein n=1 Tax=Phytopseudomonas flavescens TaxID=29435 RepID=A0A1G8IIF6_9GAMM|nr:hypothetical protein SAMN05216588_112124 [Pseudomonas flavescens]